MDALEFMQEHSRMCRSTENGPCPPQAENGATCVSCVFNLFRNPEGRIAMVEKWSAENPKITNRETFQKEFGFDGSIVSNVLPSEAGQQKIGSCGYKEQCSEGCASRHYPRCPKWWDDPFVQEGTFGENKETEGTT